MNKENIKKVVLAYSGGLDTSIIIPWLKENYNNCEVIAVSGNVGQADELEGLEEKALKTGASKLYVLDLTEEYVDDYIIPCLKAGAIYEEYLLGTSHARPCIAKGLVDIALKEGADAICHGCTGKGNDQVRFELTIKHFAPNIPIIAPWREWTIKSREEEIEYAEAHNIPLKITRETNYSKDKNLWHLSHEGLDLEDTGNEPQYEKPGFLEMGVSPIQAPDVPTYVTLDFEKGVPVALDGEKMSAKNIILKLNEIGGANGIGLLDIVGLGVVDFLFTGLDVPLTPGGDDMHLGGEVLDGQLETNLVVALAGTAVGDGIGAFLQGDVHQALGDAGTGMGGTQQILFINGAGLHAGNDEIINVFIGQIGDDALGSTGLNGLFFQTFQFVGLTHITCNCNDFAVVVVLFQPGNDNGSIQATGVCQYNFFDIFLIHNAAS